MENQTKQQRYVIVEGQRVYLTAEQQKVWDQSIRKIHYEALRDHTCTQPDYHKCFGDCSQCAWQARGNRVELDAQDEEGNGTISASFNREVDPETAFCLKETIAHIFALASEIDPMGEEILRLRFEENQTIREIADILKLSKSDVARRLSTLLSALRKNRENFF